MKEYKSEGVLFSAISIAGSDSSGGAGIQADIKTMTMNGVYSSTAITALTAQNTTGVKSILSVDPDFLSDQIDSVFVDIFPDAVKIGMIPNADLIEVVAKKLMEYSAKNIVLDPVMVSTSGASLSEGGAIFAMKKCLIPISDLITPNIPEAEVLSGISIKDRDDMEKAAKAIGDEYNVACLLKGGHSINDANDLLYSDGKFKWFCSRRIENKNTHGTGCTLSSAIASNLAKGKSMEESIELAKVYIEKALESKLDMGKGSGPLDHMVM